MEESPFRRGLLERHTKETALLIALIIVLLGIALFPGIGYNATVELTDAGPIAGTSDGGVAINRLCNGYIQANFNPLLYPISYLTGSESVFRKFRGATEFWDYDGYQLKEAVTLGTLFTEILKNLPYFLATSLLTTFLIMKLVRIMPVRKLQIKLQTKTRWFV